MRRVCTWAAFGVAAAVNAVLLCVMPAASAQDEAGTTQQEFDFFQYASIPIIAGIVGYGTNVVALKMTFYPVKFMGWELDRYMCGEYQPIGCIGWQGIIPAKVVRMAEKSVDLMTRDLFDIKELFGRMEPERVTEAFLPGLKDMMTKILGEVMRQNMPSLWESLPGDVQGEIVERSLEEAPAFLEGFMIDLQENLESVFDIKAMVVEHLEAHPEDLNNLFQKVGANEFKFIERSGAFLGFAFGIPQAVIWWFYPEWWIMPAAGFLVGYLTNWIALKMIFEPIYPHPMCCGRYNFQGVFLKRQAEVSKEFAIINTEQMLNSEYMWRSMLYGAKSDRFEAKLREHTNNFTERLVGHMKVLIVMYLGSEGYIQVKDYIARRVVEEMPNYIHHIYEYSDEALDMETTLREEMTALPPDKFEGVLHPVFQEDEIKLILVGGFLGVCVGFFQAFIVFGE